MKRKKNLKGLDPFLVFDDKKTLDFLIEIEIVFERIRGGDLDSREGYVQIMQKLYSYN